MFKLTDVITGITIEKTCSIKPFEGAGESKTINLSIKFDGVTLGDVFSKAVSGTVIQWQNGPGRKQFSTWNDKQVIEIQFKSPGKITIDPEVAMSAKLQAMGSDNERRAYIEELLAKAQPKPKVEPSTKDIEE